METVVRIRREHAGGKAIKAIRRDLKLSRKGVRKAIRSDVIAPAYQRQNRPFPKLGAFRERLDAMLVENEALPKKDRLTAMRIWDLLKRQGFAGSYDAARR